MKSSLTNPYLKEIFQPELTFVKENRFYSEIIPAIKRFENDLNLPREERIDAFIRCIGSRISLKPGNKYTIMAKVFGTLMKEMELFKVNF